MSDPVQKKATTGNTYLSLVVAFGMLKVVEHYAGWDTSSSTLRVVLGGVLIGVLSLLIGPFLPDRSLRWWEWIGVFLIFFLSVQL